MITLIIHLRIAGALLIALAVAHFPMAQRFQWREESKRLSAFNRQVLLVHAFFIALTIGLMGMLVFFWPDALITPSALGLPITAGLTLFWVIRFYCQWFIYERELWLGKRFESIAHFVFSAFWLYLTVLFALCLRLQIMR